MLLTLTRQEINQREVEKIVNRLSRNQELRDMAKNCHVKLSPLVVQSKATKSLIRAAAYSRFQWNPTQKIGPIQGQSWNPGLVVAAFEAGIPYQQIMESKQ